MKSVDSSSRASSRRLCVRSGARRQGILPPRNVGVAGLGLSVGSSSVGSPAITDYLTRVVQPLLATVEGVASADILGGQTFAMRIWLDPMRLAARQITADEVSAALLANNFQAAPGQASDAAAGGAGQRGDAHWAGLTAHAAHQGNGGAADNGGHEFGRAESCRNRIGSE